MHDKRPGRDRAWRQRPRVVSQQASGKHVLLDMESGRYYALEEVGGRVWQLCDGTRSVGDIVKVVCDEYDAAADTVGPDVEAFVSELVDESLLV
jgi:coenzyme PQQ biosynthesis protein PqqD